MANQQHIDWLLEGVEAWNARREQDDFVPDFSQADLYKAFREANKLDKFGRIPLNQANLQGAKLQGANLQEANLQWANLQGANLQGADLLGADLHGADLQEANLREAELLGAGLRGAGLREAELLGANLRGTVLREANLQRVDLQRADLQRAKLRGANLRGANLREANLKQAVLQRADVTSLVYLEAGARGSALEYTDLSTSRFLSQAQVNSMRGDSGTILPQGLDRPKYWPELEAPSAAFVFLSYSRKDEATAQHIREILTSHDIPVWWDQNIATGDSWRDEIAERLKSAKAVVTLWSQNSIVSDPVREEAARAQGDGKLVHARLDRADLPYGFGETQYSDLSDWNGTENDPVFLAFLQDLKDKLAPPSKDALEARFKDASPIAYVPKSGRLTPQDTPINARPAVDHPDDKAARLSGLQDSIERILKVISDRNTYQLPEDVHHRIRGVLHSVTADSLTWYSLEDSRDALAECMARHDATTAWNDGIVSDLKRVLRRVDELRPLLQPAQIPPGAPGAKPPAKEPHVKEEAFQRLGDIAQEVDEVLHSEVAEASLDDAARETFLREVDTIRQTNDEMPSERRFASMRRAVKGLVYAAGGLIAAVTGGVMVNLLTAPDAAKTLAAALRPILDRLIAFFT